MSVRRLGISICWCGTFALLLTTLIRLSSPSSVVAGLPEPGEVLPAEELRALMGETHWSAGKEIWVLVLTSGCSSCLGLDTDLDTLRIAARNQGVNLVPLVIPMGPSPDSLLTVLGNHELDNFRIVDPTDAFSTLRVRRVPTVLGVQDTGEISFVSSPISPGTWPLPPGFIRQDPGAVHGSG